MENSRTDWQQQIAVILVETSESLNIGSVSRSMMNFNFSDLRLVSPRGFSAERAGITACGALAPLQQATVFETLEEALKDCQGAAGFSARNGKNRGRIVPLPEWTAALGAQVPYRLGLVFGPEDNGLRQEHVELCSHLVHIPTSDVYPSMNLAQAVTLALYSIAHLGFGEGAQIERAELRDFDQLDKLISGVAEMSGFFHQGTPQPIPSVVKTIFRRQDLSQREMAIMLGLFGTALKALEGKVPIVPRKS